MRSAIATTGEIDDMKIAADELVEAIREKLELLQNSVGILYFDYEMDGDVLAGHLEQALGFPVIGCSAIATVDGAGGYHEMEAMLLVMTADDCSFSIALTEPLSERSGNAATVDAYNRARQAISTEPRLVYTLCPVGTDAMFEANMEALSGASGDLPIMGGMPYTESDPDRTIVYGGRYTETQAVVLLIGGNLRPVCALANVVSRFTEKRGTITKAHDDVIEEVDGVPFTEFIASYGLDVSDITDTAEGVFYQNYPLLVENIDKKADGVPFVRILKSMNADAGSGEAFADFPLGEASISLGVLQRDDIRKTVEEGIKGLLRQVEENSGDGYTYSTVLCITCAARHMVMNPYYDTEGNAIREILPDTLHLSGFYSHGELCPTSIREGKAKNRLHNGSITFCAF